MTGSLLAIILTIVPFQQSYLTPLQQRDSVLIADQLEYGVQMDKVEEGTLLLFPEVGNQPDSALIRILTPWQVDTVKVHRQGKGRPRLYDIKAGITITTFQEGEYILPPIAVERHSPDGAVDTLVFDPIPLSVKTLPIDTENFELHDIKGQIRYPVTLREVLPYIAAFQLLAVLIILIVCLIIMRKRRGVTVEERKDPAHIVALRKLDHYRGDKLWAPEKQKSFYSGVTDALREYIASRYGVSAMEMTTGEIFSDLKDSDIPEDLRNELESLFQRADYVKFAKYVASDQENAGAVPLAVRFVTTTYQAEVESDE